MFEFRGAREAERGRAERGTAGMSVAERVQRDIAQQQRDSDRDERQAAIERAARAAERAAIISNIQGTTSDMQRMLIDQEANAQIRQQMAAQDALALQRLKEQEAAANIARGVSADAARLQAMANMYRPGGQSQPLAPSFVYAGGSPAVRVAPSVAVGPAAFRAQEAARAMGLSQRQAGFDAYQAMLSDAAAAAQANIAASSPGFFGAPTRFMNERFLEGFGSRMGGRDSEAYQRYLSDPNLFSPVYDTTGRLTGYRDERGRLTGRDPIAEEEERRRREGEGEPEIVSTVTDPMTGQEKCPDGYIFDEDLQACRLAPMERVATDTTPGEAYARMGLLDVAPEGLMGFRERYGAGFGTPMDFGAANLAFRRQGATYPEYFQTPPKLDGYTLLT